jgi:diguanylate cyclase (GGDEF)-like protein
MGLLYSKKDLSKSVSCYMTSPIETISDDVSIKEAIKFMQDKHFKRIVVVNSKNELSGIILQKELIALSYNKWTSLMKNYQEELKEINLLLEKKSKKYEKIAGTDPLTGLYNRYKFTELFLSEFKTMVQRANAMSLLFIDIDYFKKINDTHGHNVGDNILIDVSNTLLQQLRAVDILSRWGGEEFVVLLPTATAVQAEKLAQKMREKISEKPLSGNINATISIGVTEVTYSDSLESAIKRADDALYGAKESGRNCVRVC